MIEAVQHINTSRQPLYLYIYIYKLPDEGFCVGLFCAKYRFFKNQTTTDFTEGTKTKIREEKNKEKQITKIKKYRTTRICLK